MGEFVPFEPYATISGETTGTPADNPPGVKASIETARPVRSNPGTYRIMPHGVLRVMNIECRSRHTQIDKALADWRPILSGNDPQQIQKSGQLEELLWMNAAQAFHAKPRILDLPWGKAALFLTTYVQGNHGGPVNNDELTLVVQGVTHDGRHFVSAHLAIRHPKLPEDAWDEHHRGRVYFPIDADDDTAIESWLNRQADDSFTPSLNDVATMLRSMTIN